MDIRKLQRVIVDGLEDLKAQNILVFNTEHLSALFERVIIASGTSNRQTKSLASSVREAVKKAGYPVPRTEGEGNGEWIIVDCGAAVVHVMQPLIRDYYHLEEIWGDKPVNMKLASATTRLVKAAEPEAPARKTAAKKKTAPAKLPVKAAPVKKTAAKKAAPTKTTAARKAPAKKAPPPAARMITRVVGVKKTPVKKAAVPAKRAAPAKKAPAKKVARKA
jgi:ribosome-associated protein